MGDTPTAFITIILTAFITTALAVVAWLVARKSGLGDLQIAVKSETDRLVSAQKERIELLEEKVLELAKRIESLEKQGLEDKIEIARLRKVIADKAIEEIG